MSSATERREELKHVWEEAKTCTRCQLHQTRTTVVFGAGNADAELMFVGEAPGANEDKQGLPFVGQAGKLLDKLLGEIGMERADVFICNTLKCLRYNAMVQLGDGSWERIARLVKDRYAGDVMSVDENGRLVPRRVTGWHATPLAGRRVFQLSFRSAKPNNKGKANVQLTADHPVLTERGYVQADELRSGDRVATGQGLSDLAFDVVCGTLLGDGSIPKKTAMMTMAHSWKQEEYARLKAYWLRELDPATSWQVVAAMSGGTPAYDTVHVRTRAHRALRGIRDDFYRPKKIVPGWIEEALNPRMLAIWFLDDGYTRIRPGGRQPLAEIATVSFSDADLQVLINGLAQLGLPAKASRSRLYFDVPTTRRLSEIIAPYTPPCLRYKLVPEVEEAIPYDVSQYWMTAPKVMYDEVEIEDVTDQPRADTTFFCLDVEETHNFVTAGGVVHNCRPPNNRDPQPREIETCEPYLRRQVELIQPTMICTLGNFATKLLRGDPTGISRLHGQEEDLTIGVRTVRLYPIYHPAAALYTPSTLEMLRADFRRIPELLALGPPAQPDLTDPVPSLEELRDAADDSAPSAGAETGEAVVPDANAGPAADTASPPPAAEGGGNVRNGTPPDEQLGLF